MSNTRICAHCAHMQRKVEGTPCQVCMLGQDKPAWESKVPTPKFKIGDRVRMISEALKDGCRVGSEGTITHVRETEEQLFYPYIVEYGCGKWAAEESWLEAVEPAPKGKTEVKTRKVCLNLGAACPFCKEEAIPVEPTIVEPPAKFKAGDAVILIKDGLGINACIGCKGEVIRFSRLSEVFGNIYAVHTTLRDGGVLDYEVPEAQMELAPVAPTPKFKTGDKVVLIQDGWGIYDCAGCKGTVIDFVCISEDYGTLYAVDTITRSGVVLNYDVPECQMAFDTIEATPKFKAGDTVVLVRDRFGITSGLGGVGGKGTVIGLTRISPSFGNIYTVNIPWRNGSGSEYEIPESQMELVSMEITPVEQSAAEKIAAIIELIRPGLMKAVEEDVDCFTITVGRNEGEV